MPAFFSKAITGFSAKSLSQAQGGNPTPQSLQTTTQEHLERVDTFIEVSPDKMAEVFRGLLGGFAPSSQQTIYYGLSQIAEELGFPPSTSVDRQPWHQVRPQDLDEVVQRLQERGLSKSTVRLYVYALRALLRALYVRRLIDGSDYFLMREMKLPRGRNKTGRGRAVERHYRDALLACCLRDERPQGRRDAAIIACLFASGVRRSELASFRVEHLNLAEGSAIIAAKGGDTKVRYLAPWAMPYLIDWLKLRATRLPPIGPVFVAIPKGGRFELPRDLLQRSTGTKAVPKTQAKTEKTKVSALTGRGILFLLEERSKQAGLPFLVRPHDARRTLATTLIIEQGELAAQRVLGHADLSTTRIYDKRSDAFVKEILKTQR